MEFSDVRKKVIYLSDFSSVENVAAPALGPNLSWQLPYRYEASVGLESSAEELFSRQSVVLVLVSPVPMRRNRGKPFVNLRRREGRRWVSLLLLPSTRPNVLSSVRRATRLPVKADVE